MAETVFSATGRRKEAVAHVTIALGGNRFTINGRSLDDYLTRPTLVEVARAPLALTELTEGFQIQCKASGGGLSGQAGAVRLALSRALITYNPDLRAKLKKAGYLTRDARIVERKKYGQPKARKRFQYSKR